MEISAMKLTFLSSIRSDICVGNRENSGGKEGGYIVESVTCARRWWLCVCKLLLLGNCMLVTVSFFSRISSIPCDFSTDILWLGQSIMFTLLLSFSIFMSSGFDDWFSVISYQSNIPGIRSRFRRRKNRSHHNQRFYSSKSSLMTQSQVSVIITWTVE